MTSQGPPHTHCHANVCKLATTQRQDSGVCACVCMCAHVCVCACMHVCVRAYVDRDTNKKIETEMDPGQQELSSYLCLLQASLVVQTVKNLPAMQETSVRSLGWEGPLEKEMATHSSTLAWRILLWTEEPGSLQSMGSQRVSDTSQMTVMLHPLFILK